MSVPDLIFIVGPTAVGKSAFAMAFAEEVNAEIVSCDSMQVYQEIAIASNKPSPEELQRVPHHLIDVISVKESFDAAAYRKLALQAIESILKRGKVPLVVGGSGLYVQVLLDGIFEGAPGHPGIRGRLSRELEQEGSRKLYDRLKQQDPEAAEKIHPNNTKRLIRALEILESQTETFTSLKKKRFGLWDQYQIKVIGLDMDRDDLYEAIHHRVDRMFADGLMDEVKRVLPLMPSVTAGVLIGVKEVRGYLEGQYDLDEAKSRMKKNTRHYAKRQWTWFRKDKRIEWITYASNEQLEQEVKRLVKEWYGKGS